MDVIPEPIVEHILTWLGATVTEFRNVLVVCKQWRRTAAHNDRLLRRMLRNFLVESRWSARNVKVDHLIGTGDDHPPAQPPSTPAPADADADADAAAAATHSGVPVAPSSAAADGNTGAGAGAGAGVAVGVGVGSGASPHTPTSPSPLRGGDGDCTDPLDLSLHAYVQLAEQQDREGDFSFGRFQPDATRFEAPSSWLQALRAFHCSLDNYVLLSKLGNERSSYYRARVISTGVVVCLKDLSDDEEHEGVPPRTLREISVLQQLRHPAVLTPTRLLQSPYTVRGGHTRLYLSFPLMGPSLREVIFRMDGTLHPRQVREYMRDLMAALAYLHSRGIIRRTLQLDKLLLTPDRKHLKLNNFQHSRQFARLLGAPVVAGTTQETDNVTASPPIAYNLCYCPPELLLGQKSDAHDWAVDSWHAGCMMAAMLRGEPLFFGDSKVGQMMQIFNLLGRPDESNWPGVTHLPHYPTFLPNFRARALSSVIQLKAELAAEESTAMFDLLGRLLALHPRSRISPAEALTHPFFTGGRMEDYSPQLEAAPARANQAVVVAALPPKVLSNDGDSAPVVYPTPDMELPPRSLAFPKPAGLGSSQSKSRKDRKPPATASAPVPTPTPAAVVVAFVASTEGGGDGGGAGAGLSLAVSPPLAASTADHQQPADSTRVTRCLADLAPSSVPSPSAKRQRRQRHTPSRAQHSPNSDRSGCACSAVDSGDEGSRVRPAEHDDPLWVPQPFPGHPHRGGSEGSRRGVPLFATTDTTTACCVAREVRAPLPVTLFGSRWVPGSPSPAAVDLEPLGGGCSCATVADVPVSLRTVHVKACKAGDHPPLDPERRAALSWQLAQYEQWKHTVSGASWVFDPSATLFAKPQSPASS